MFHKYLNQKGYKWIFERTFDDLNCQCILFGPLRVWLVNLKLQSLLNVFLKHPFQSMLQLNILNLLHPQQLTKPIASSECSTQSHLLVSVNQQKPLEAHPEPEGKKCVKI